METRDLVRMANQIGDFFKGYGEDYATQEIATHINAYWDPRMRVAFFAHVDSGGAGFAPLVLAAATNVKRPGAGPHPAQPRHLFPQAGEE
jgi:formate dehydrogenase subunit delta